MAKLVIRVSTNKLGSEMTREVEIDYEDVNDEELIDEIVQDNVNEMINVSYDIKN